MEQQSAFVKFFLLPLILFFAAYGTYLALPLIAGAALLLFYFLFFTPIGWAILVGALFVFI